MSQASPNPNDSADLSTSNTSEREPADVHQSSFGATVTITLTGDDLRALGINPSEACTVLPRVYNGALLLDTALDA